MPTFIPNNPAVINEIINNYLGIRIVAVNIPGQQEHHQVQDAAGNELSEVHRFYTRAQSDIPKPAENYLNLMRSVKLTGALWESQGGGDTDEISATVSLPDGRKANYVGTDFVSALAGALADAIVLKAPAEARQEGDRADGRTSTSDPADTAAADAASVSGKRASKK